MSSELYQTIEMIGREKGIDPDVIIQAVEEAYAAASRKYLRSKEDFGARFDRDSGQFIVFSKQTVVTEDELMDPHTEITVEEAREIRPDAEIGSVIETVKQGIDVPLTRIAAQAAKQVIYQKVKEAEREIVWREYGDRIGELLTGQVKRFDRGDMIVDLGRTEGIIPRREQSRAEHYNPGDRIRAVLVNVERLGKGPQLTLSRASELLVKKLFEMEVPEIYDGTVVIKSAVREPGERAKIAVMSNERDVDPVGACVGMKGSRVQAIIRELRGEKIDIIPWHDDIVNYAQNALAPAKITRVSVTSDESAHRPHLDVIVDNDQLSLAIGKRGLNVRLAAELIGAKIDIKSEEEVKGEVADALSAMLQEAMADQRSQTNVHDIDEMPAELADKLEEAGYDDLDSVLNASIDDLTAIEGIDAESAAKILEIAGRHEEVQEQTPEEPPEEAESETQEEAQVEYCLLYTSPSPRDGLLSRMPSSA